MKSEYTKSSIETLEYFEQIAECECDSPLPIGGCLKCSLQNIILLLQEDLKQNDES